MREHHHHSRVDERATVVFALVRPSSRWGRWEEEEGGLRGGGVKEVSAGEFPAAESLLLSAYGDAKSPERTNFLL